MIDVEDFTQINCEGWHGLLRDDMATVFAEGDPWQTVITNEHATVQDSPSVSGVRFCVNGISLHAKLTVAPNDVAAERFSPGATLRWLARGSSAMRALRITRQMQAAGLNCPDPILAARRRNGLHAEDLYISKLVDGTWLLHAWQNAADHGVRDQLINRAGEVIAQFHAAGFLHGNLAPAKLIVSDDMQRVTFVDNEGALRWPGSLPVFLRKQNLLQFLLGFRLLDDSVLQRLIRAYCRASGYGSATQQRFMNVLIPRVRARAEKLTNLPDNLMPCPEPDDASNASRDESKLTNDA